MTALCIVVGVGVALVGAGVLLLLWQHFIN